MRCRRINLNVENIVKGLNGKRYYQLIHNLKRLVVLLFGTFKEKDMFRCIATEADRKPNFFVRANGVSKYIYVWNEKSIIVHNEMLAPFITFLKESNISEKTIETILLFHYGDGTTDGHEETKYKSFQIIKGELRHRIFEANKELNADESFILSFLERFVFRGINKNYPSADAIYFGDKISGFVATKEQLLKRMRNTKYVEDRCLHVGPVLFRPHSRYVTGIIRNERNRKRIVVSWPNLKKDIIELELEEINKVPATERDPIFNRVFKDVAEMEDKNKRVRRPSNIHWHA